MTLMDREKEPLTIEFKINFLNIADGEKLVAEAEILKAGRSIFHGESKVYTIKKKEKLKKKRLEKSPGVPWDLSGALGTPGSSPGAPGVTCMGAPKDLPP